LSRSSKNSKAKNSKAKKKSTTSTKKVNPLYSWIVTQRRLGCGTMKIMKNGGKDVVSKEKIKLLNDIGFNWNPKNDPK
jgi:hypothetical protein